MSARLLPPPLSGRLRTRRPPTGGLGDGRPSVATARLDPSALREPTGPSVCDQPACRGSRVKSAPVLAVSSLWFNMEALLAVGLPSRWSRVLLGVCGGAATYGAPDLAEFELPAKFADRLEQRSS